MDQNDIHYELLSLEWYKSLTRKFTSDNEGCFSKRVCYTKCNILQISTNVDTTCFYSMNVLNVFHKMKMAGLNG
jgi:hypothetical protein